MRRNTWKIVCSLLLFACNLSVTSCREMYGKTFHRIDSSYLGIVPMGNYYSESIISCCNLCFKLHQSAYVAYNNIQASCVCVRELTTNQAPFLGSDVVLYGIAPSSECDYSSGFNLYIYENVTVCLLIVPDPETHADAQNNCANYPNGRLFVADTIFKLELLGEVTDRTQGLSSEIYIGMDDQITENQFVWADGRNATPTEMQELFYANEPNNLDNEDCVVMSRTQRRLNDFYCSSEFSYVCEMPIRV